MTLENQVVSLDLAKRLKELGVKQESYFVWSNYDFEDEQGRFVGNGKGVDNWIISTSEDDEGISAFTSSELGEMLPQILEIKGIKYQVFLSAGLDKQWFVVYANINDYHDNAPLKFMLCHNEADARAKMLIHLIENNLL